MSSPAERPFHSAYADRDPDSAETWT